MRARDVVRVTGCISGIAIGALLMAMMPVLMLAIGLSGINQEPAFRWLVIGMSFGGMLAFTIWVGRQGSKERLRAKSRMDELIRRRR